MNNSSRKKVVIIGGGAAGTLVAFNLLLKTSPALDVTIVERFDALGQGVTYRTSEPWHRLSAPASAMSVLEHDPDHFFQWVKDIAERHHPLLNKIPTGYDFLPRAIYGEYLSYVLNESIAKALRRGSVFTSVRGEAVDLVFEKNVKQVILADGNKLDADFVVLALGNLPSQYPISRHLPVYKDPRYIHFPWDRDRVHRIRKSDSVLLLGTGKTAVDLAISLKSRGHAGEIAMMSKMALVPQSTHSFEGDLPDFNWISRQTSIRTIFHVLKNFADRGGLPAWQSMIDKLRPYIPSLWMGLDNEERKRFLRHLQLYWEAVRYRLAPEIEEQLNTLLRSGELKRIAARIHSLEAGSSGLEITFTTKKNTEPQCLRAGWVINCTGPRSDFSKFQHPLLVSLLAEGLMNHDPLSLGMNAMPDGRLISYWGEAQDWLFTIGLPMKGVLWECTSIPELRQQAARISHQIGDLATR